MGSLDLLNRSSDANLSAGSLTNALSLTHCLLCRHEIRLAWCEISIVVGGTWPKRAEMVPSRLDWSNVVQDMLLRAQISDGVQSSTTLGSTHFPLECGLICRFVAFSTVFGARPWLTGQSTLHLANNLTCLFDHVAVLMEASAWKVQFLAGTYILLCGGRKCWPINNYSWSFATRSTRARALQVQLSRVLFVHS